MPGPSLQEREAEEGFVCQQRGGLGKPQREDGDGEEGQFGVSV